MRLKTTGQVFDLTVKPIDVYDFATDQWLPESASPMLPTPRAGNMVMAWGEEIVIGGRESTQKTAHDQVEAYNVKTGQWRDWPSLERGRHGSGFAIVGDHVYTASGSGGRGGSPGLTSIERLKLITE
ncbi:kelch repeat-containing protein [Novipirellula rosea]|uniref:N-acetylneuraminate epimerase n=1 Tax=Novipirellula rosea TaxID=1031540 RepID=A0ABP8N3Q7_9BACT